MKAEEVHLRILSVFTEKKKTAASNEWQWSRKPDRWDMPMNSVSAEELRNADPVAFDMVPVITLSELYGDDEVYSSTPWSTMKSDARRSYHLDKADGIDRYSSDPDQVLTFIVDARQQGSGHILVNSEGYDYLRYVVRLSDFDEARRGKVTPNPVDLMFPGDMLLDIARVLDSGSVGGIGIDRARTILEWMTSSAPQIITQERLEDYER